MRVVDSHCHLETKDFADRDAVIARARDAGVCHFVTVGSGDSLANVQNAVALAEAHDDFSAAIGIHPHDVARMTDETFAEIERLCMTHAKVVAVGETGLDYHYDHSPREVQRREFARFIALARRCKKPLVLHIREAHDDAIDLFSVENGRDAGAIVHCFTGTADEARRWLDLGATLSFSGILTFKSAGEIRRAAALAPADRVLVETDCPYLAPVPYRGKQNEPAFVVETLKVLAATRGVEVDEMARLTVENTARAFRLTLTP